jgi:hypothetical protein
MNNQFEQFELSYNWTIDGYTISAQDSDFDSASALIGIANALDALCKVNNISIDELIFALKQGNQSLVSEKRSKFKVVK